MNAPSGLVVPVTRATAPSSMSNAAPVVRHDARQQPPLERGQERRPTTAMPKPMSVSMFGVSPAAMRMRERERLDARADPAARVGRDERMPLLIA